MDILMVPIPLFSKQMAVEAYYFRYQRGNDVLLEGNAAGVFDGAMNSPMLETFKMVGVEPFAMDKPVFVPISSMMLLGDLSRQCPQPFENIIFLMEGDVKPEPQYVEKIQELKHMGFRFAMCKVDKPTDYEAILLECEYLFLDQKSSAASIDTASLPPRLRFLKLVATHIDTFDVFKKLATKRFVLFEGRFYRLPLTKGKTSVAPLKVNLVKLLNTVQDENFEFQDIANIIERDTALSISLMRLVNSPYIGLSEKVKTISHAIAMLGESEVRKWATTSVSRLLGSDKPDEITRLSLIRAKFAENLAEFMDMTRFKQSVFLTGLFSVMDVVLDLPMNEALKLVQVDDDIYNALVNHTGPFYPIIQFIYSYEQSDWKEVSRQLIIDDIEVANVYQAYINATLWYKDLIDEASDK